MGHVKAVLLNEFFARRYPLGELICRFDDTNPSKESMEFHDAILQDLKILVVIPDKVTYSSDAFQTMYELAIQLIKAGKASPTTPSWGKMMRAGRIDCRQGIVESSVTVTETR